MAQTKFFDELRKNIQQAEHALLCGIQSTLDVQDENEKYRIQSYILVAHAEFEYYIENIALYIRKYCIVYIR